MSDTPRTDECWKEWLRYDGTIRLIEEKSPWEIARKLEREKNQFRKALEHILEYCNRDHNETAMVDALWHIIVTAEDALREDMK